MPPRPSAPSTTDDALERLDDRDAAQALGSHAIEYMFALATSSSSSHALPNSIVERVFGADGDAEASIASTAARVADVCRRGLEGDSAVRFLTHERACSRASAEGLVAAADANRERIVAALREASGRHAFRALHSVRWRLDVDVGKNDPSRSVRDPVFHVALVSRTGDVFEEVRLCARACARIDRTHTPAAHHRLLTTNNDAAVAAAAAALLRSRQQQTAFVCNLEEMQALVATMKDARLAMQRNVQEYG